MSDAGPSQAEGAAPDTASSAQSETARVVGSHSEYLLAPDAPELVIERLADPAIKVLTLTVTEKGYCLDFQKGCLDTGLERSSLARRFIGPLSS